MVMDRDQVIEAMCEAVNDMNRQIAWQNGIPSDQMDETINNMQSELAHGNGVILDKLIELDIVTDL
tara:strand:- start:1609 stop:1806 length:198 start_codon:yes stop_codon:yes gene_type:complete